LILRTIRKRLNATINKQDAILDLALVIPPPVNDIMSVLSRHNANVNTSKRNWWWCKEWFIGIYPLSGLWILSTNKSRIKMWIFSPAKIFQRVQAVCSTVVGKYNIEQEGGKHFSDASVKSLVANGHNLEVKTDFLV
jgi:hypothetical protein